MLIVLLFLAIRSSLLAFLDIFCYLMAMNSTKTSQSKQLKRGQFPLTREQVDSIIDHAGSVRDRIILSLLAFCGLRRGEVSNLKVEHLDIETGRLTIIGKRKKLRIVPVPPSVLGELKIYLKGNRRQWMFPAKLKRGPLVDTRINAIVANAARAAHVKNPCPDLKKVNPHSLRHSYARILKKAGVPLEAVQNVLGHKNLSTTMNIYGLMSVDDVHDAVVGVIS